MLPFTRKDLETWTGRQIFQDGLRLFEKGVVVKVEFIPQDRRIEAFIDRKPRGLKTGFYLDEDGLPENGCPCADSRERDLFCTHAVASALELIKLYSNPERLAKLEQEVRRAEKLAQIDEDEFIQRVPESESHVAARLHLELVDGWSDYFLKEGKIPLACAIEYGDVLQPIGEAPLDMPFHFKEAQENLLFVIEDICEGPATSRFDAGLSDFSNILELLHGQHFSDGATNAPIFVEKDSVPSYLRLDMDNETGELVLSVESDLPVDLDDRLPLYFIARKKGWAFFNNQIWPLAKLLPAPLHQIYQEPVVVERNRVPAFLETEWPALQAHMESRSDLSLDLFDFLPGNPSYKLVVKGSPASLAAEFSACYGDQCFVAGRPDAGATYCEPDAEDLMAYRVRNLDREAGALGRLGEYGFPGQYGDDLTPIVGAREVRNFLASSYPALRRMGWQVEIQGRVVDYMENVDYATPVVQVQGSGEDWFEVGFEFESSSGTSLSSSDIQRAIRMGESFVEKGGKTVFFDSDAISGLNSVFEDCASGEASKPGSFKMNSVFAPYVKSSLDSLDGVDFDAGNDWVARSSQFNREGKIEPLVLDEPLKSTLRDYQTDGVNWLHFIASRGFSGILADEMGLGKTLQTLTWLRHLLNNMKDRPGPALIVCPTSLVENWTDEAEKFTPDVKFANLTGSGRHKKWDELEKADVIVTSYALIRRDMEKLGSIEWAAMILDEAQHIKNRNTQNAQAAKQILARNKLVLTGTPVENSVSDLWSIMDFLMPGYMGTHEHFKMYYQNPIEEGGNIGDQAQKKLRRKLHPFMLRRLKKDVAKDLPPKIEKVSYCRLTPDQQKVYKELLEASRRKITDMVDTQGFNKSRMEVLKTLLRLRQASCHLDLLKLPLDAKRPSGKLELFEELLQEAMDGGHRILVFSQFTTMLGLLREHLEAKGLRYSYLDGSTKNRMERVKEFNKDHEIPVFLISLKAGGTGLNLTGADMVIHFDPWWNPAVEDQATDRAYRIGQKRTVYAHKFIARGTVEEKVLKMQKKKKAIIDATLENDDQVMSKLDWDDVQDLLSL